MFNLNDPKLTKQEKEFMLSLQTDKELDKEVIRHGSIHQEGSFRGREAGQEGACHAYWRGRSDQDLVAQLHEHSRVHFEDVSGPQRTRVEEGFRDREHGRSQAG